MTTPVATVDDPGPLWDIRTVAARLGVQVRHVRRLVSERRIPFIKWGRLLRFDPAEIECWLDSARRRAGAEQLNGGPGSNNHVIRPPNGHTIMQHGTECERATPDRPGRAHGNIR